MKNDLKDLGIFTYPVLQINGMVYKVKLKGTNEIRAVKVIQRHILNEELSLN